MKRRLTREKRDAKLRPCTDKRKPVAVAIVAEEEEEVEVVVRLLFPELVLVLLPDDDDDDEEEGKKYPTHPRTACIHAATRIGPPPACLSGVNASSIGNASKPPKNADEMKMKM